MTPKRRGTRSGLTEAQRRYLTSPEAFKRWGWPSECEEAGHPFETDEGVREALREHRGDAPYEHPLAWWWE